MAQTPSSVAWNVRGPGSGRGENLQLASDRAAEARSFPQHVEGKWEYLRGRWEALCWASGWASTVVRVSPHLPNRAWQLPRPLLWGTVWPHSQFRNLETLEKDKWCFHKQSPDSGILKVLMRGVIHRQTQPVSWLCPSQQESYLGERLCCVMC